MSHDQMKIKKRNGSLEPVNLDKIVKAVGRAGEGLDVDPMRVALKTIGGLYDGASTAELDQLSIRTAAALTAENPQYGFLAARLLGAFLDKEVTGLGIHAFSQAIEMGVTEGLINDRLAQFVRANARKLNDATAQSIAHRFEYFGLRTVYDRYLLRHPTRRSVIETPAYFFMRVACALGNQDMAETLALYDRLSTLDYLTSSPTLFNAGTLREQLSSCYLLDSPEDSLDSIYDRYKDVARLSKLAGGIGVSFARVRARGSLIKGTNGFSNGVVPWLKTLDSSVASVNQCFSPDTLLHTADGIKAIRDVNIGDLVLGISGDYRKVLKKMTYNQVDPMVQLKVKHSVKALEVTSGHPFYAIQGIPLEFSCATGMKRLANGKATVGWVNAGSLKKGDYVGQVIPREIVPVNGFTTEDARLYGIMLGDGHASGDGHEWGVSGNPQKDEHLKFVREYLSARGIHYWENNRGTEYGQVRWATGVGVVRDATTGRIVGAGAPTLPFTREDVYAPSGEKRIARRFAHLPKDQTLALIHGLLETDGGVSRGSEIYFTNTSVDLAEGIRYQCLRLGVPTAGQYRERSMDHTGTRSDGSTCKFQGVCKAYDIRIPAVPFLADLVGCAHITKKNWLEYDGQVFSRVKSVQEVQAVPFVFDLMVEGDESYMTVAGLAHNGGKRKGAACVYLENWHADVEEFLELRDNTGDEARRTHNLNLANWVSDEFMRRVEADGSWSLFDPAKVPHLVDLWGEAFEMAYRQAEADGLASKTLKARDLYARMLRTLAQTGNGWMTFKDHANAKSNQTALAHNVIHLSNLCTEILEVTTNAETAVCNLGSVNLAHHLNAEGTGIDYDKLAATVKIAVRQLNRVIDINFYPIDGTRVSNAKWRPVGLGLMGLQDVFFKLGLPFDSAEALALSNRISEEIYYHALATSADLAETDGKHPGFEETRAARGQLQFDHWGVTPSDAARWNALRERIQTVGLRNSLLIAIAPTATIASIAGCYECIEPQVSNLFKRETLSGDFLVVNRYLTEALMRLNLWTDEVREAIKRADGSIQGIDVIPAKLREIYRTAWELKMKPLIDLAAGRGAYIDQGQSLNLFMENPNIGQMSSMYLYAWKAGLKTTYYLRSRPATKIAKTTVAASVEVAKETLAASQDQASAAVFCSLENPEACEACQ